MRAVLRVAVAVTFVAVLTQAMPLRQLQQQLQTRKEGASAMTLDQLQTRPPMSVGTYYYPLSRNDKPDTHDTRQHYLFSGTCQTLIKKLHSKAANRLGGMVGVAMLETRVKDKYEVVWAASGGGEDALVKAMKDRVIWNDDRDKSSYHVVTEADTLNMANALTQKAKTHGSSWGGKDHYAVVEGGVDCQNSARDRATVGAAVAAALAYGGMHAGTTAMAKDAQVLLDADGTAVTVAYAELHRLNRLPDPKVKGDKSAASAAIYAAKRARAAGHCFEIIQAVTSIADANNGAATTAQMILAAAHAAQGVAPNTAVTNGLANTPVVSTHTPWIKKAIEDAIKTVSGTTVLPAKAHPTHPYCKANSVYDAEGYKNKNQVKGCWSATHKVNGGWERYANAGCNAMGNCAGSKLAFYAKSKNVDVVCMAERSYLGASVVVVDTPGADGVGVAYPPLSYVPSCETCRHAIQLVHQ